VANVVGCWLATGDEALEDPPDAAGAALLFEDDDPEPASPPMLLTALHVPVNDPESPVTVYLFVTSASGPGFGNWTSLPPTVVHPFPRLATKRSGRLEYPVAGALRVAELPAFTVTEAQDM
jgi:hypothetical protein